MTTKPQNLAALIAATDENGRVDLTRFQAERLINSHQTIDGLDAEGVVRDIIDSPAYRDEQGRAEVKPLLDAIGNRLNVMERDRFNVALDRHNVAEGWAERLGERSAAVITSINDAIKEKAVQVEGAVSDTISGARAKAIEERDDPTNNPVGRGIASAAANAATYGQFAYGSTKGSVGAAVGMVCDVVDTAQLVHRFATDDNFRSVITSAARLYADEVRRDPSRPLNDVQRVATNEWNEWVGGLKEAKAQGKQAEYLGEASGAVGLNLLLTAAGPAGAIKLAKLGRVVGDLDGPDTPDLPDARSASDASRGGHRPSHPIVGEFMDLAEREQARPGGSDADDNLFKGLAGIRRSQGELRGLVATMRAEGRLDGLLESGALAPRELAYLARTDIGAFDGGVPFARALGRSVGTTDLTELSPTSKGDLGEAILSHRLAREGYADLLPIQNNSGHGVDLVGLNTKTGRVEVFEVKASAIDKAEYQSGNPNQFVVSRLTEARDSQGNWTARNQWEEQAQSTAARLLEDLYDPINDTIDLDTKWARMNLRRNADGSIEAKDNGQIKDWIPPEQREQQKLDRKTDKEASASIDGDMSQPGHPGHASYKRSYAEVRRMESVGGIAESPNTALLATSVATAVEREKLDLQRVELGKGGQVFAIERGAYPDFLERRVGVDTMLALGRSMEQGAQDWLAARSPHYQSGMGLGERSQEVTASLARMPAGDRVMFDAIRAQAPSSVSDEHVALAAVQARQAGVNDPSKMEGITMRGDTLWVIGNTPGFRTNVDVSSQAPSMQQVTDQAQTNDQKRQLTQANEREVSERTQANVMRHQV